MLITKTTFRSWPGVSAGLGLSLAGSLAASIPFAAAPFIAGAAALGIVLALAAIITGRRV